MSRKQKAALQPDREEVPTVGVSRNVLAMVEVTDPGKAGFAPWTCHLLSCWHLAPVLDMEQSSNGRRPPDNDYAKVQKRRCLACAALEQARPLVKTLLIQAR